jgi:Tfp pilus assembly protein PilN
VVDIGARSTDLIFMEGNRAFIRSVPVAGNAITQQLMGEFDTDFADAQEMKHAHAFVSFGPAYENPASEVADRVSKSARSVMTRMHAEINRSINFYRSQQGGSKPARILLAGGGSVIAHTDTFLREKLGVEAEYLNPFQNVAVSETVSSDEIARHAHELGEVVGLGLRRVLTCPIEINLMPPRMVADRAFRAKQPLLVLAAALLVLTLGVWGAYFLRMGKLTQARLDKVQTRLQVVQQMERRLVRAEKDVEAVQSDVDVLLSLAEARTRWVEILNEIRSLKPEGMWLTRVASFRADVEEPQPAKGAPGAQRVGEAPISHLELSGLAYTDKVRDTGPLITFRDGLQASPLFTDQSHISWSPAPGLHDVTRDYRITVYLEKPLQL